ncbi:response regulator [Zavarzinia sp. CC-PAN008]|uniref:response regulator n=1 Tax=Zavarzinia sp. CC-PAN008 TaxID=3243332 RepID=UPI003F74666F
MATLPQTPGPIDVVVIDDHKDYLAFLQELLERAGHCAQAFSSARTALRFLETTPARVVVTDVFMSDLDGFEVLRTLRARHPALPVIAICGAGTSQDAMFLGFMEKLGACRTFRKPICQATFLAAVRALLAGPAAPCDGAGAYHLDAAAGA